MRLAAGAALALLLTACQSQTVRPRQTVRLGIGAQQSISQVPVYLADQLGYFRDAGVAVELAEFPGASKGMEALLGGSADVLSAYYPQVLQVRRQGRDVQAFHKIHDSLLVAIAAASGSGLESVEALRGKTIGVTTLGSATHQFLDHVLRTAGVDPSSVTPIAIGTAARAVAALEHRQVQAAVVTDFTIRTLEKRFGRLKILADTRTRAGTLAVHGVESFPGTALMAQSSWLSANPDSARRISSAVARAMDWMRTHPAEEIAARMPESHYGGERETYAASLAGSVEMLAHHGSIDEAGVRASFRFLGLEYQPDWKRSLFGR